MGQDRKKYHHSKEGLIGVIYNSQRQKSKERGHPEPAYTLSDLRDWVLSQPLYHHLFHLWEVSNYDKMIVPSLDRLDDYEPYSFSNIQLMTWRENKKKSFEDRKAGRNNKTNVAVIQFTKDGEFIAEYHSTMEAERITGTNHGHISKVCKGKYKTAGGFVWKKK